MTNNRELSQFGSVLNFDEDSNFIGINTLVSETQYTVGIGTSILFFGSTGILSATAIYANGENIIDIIDAKAAEAAAFATTAGFSTYASFAGFATDAGISTNIKGGDTGDIPYQSAADTTTFLDASSASTGQIILWSGSAPIWSDVSAASGSFGGITIQEDGSTVGTADSVSIVNFGSGLIASSSGIGATIIAQVGLGSDTTGDYVDSITGTAGQIDVTGGTGEGSTPTISLANNTSIPGNPTIAGDLQVNSNLNVSGNITLGGTTAFVTETILRTTNPDVIVGYTTNIDGDDASTDITANSGGIAIASTEGTPLVDLVIAGIETLPVTYKKIQWYRAGAFSGLGTDAFLINYALGVGTTEFQSGVRLAVGSGITMSDTNISATSFNGTTFTGTTFDGTTFTGTANAVSNSLTKGNYVTYSSGTTYNGSAAITIGVDATSANTGDKIVVRDSGGNFSAGVITATTFDGNAGTATSLATARNIGGVSFDGTADIDLPGVNTSGNQDTSGNAATATNAGLATDLSINATNELVLQTGNNATSTLTNGTSGYLLQSNGSGSSPTWVNSATFSVSSASTTTDVIGGIASVTQLSVSGVSTLGTVEVSSGIITAASGIVTYYGDGQYLTGLGFKEDSDFNLFAGSNSGGGYDPAVNQGRFNVAIGYSAAYNLNEGDSNVFLGRYSGFCNTDGCYNVFSGHQSGYRVTTGNNNISLGFCAGYGSVDSTGSYNIFLGNCAAYSITSGASNIVLGNCAGHNLTTGDSNVFIGCKSGYNHTAFGNNVFLGTQAGECSNASQINVLIGAAAGQGINDGSRNVMLGSRSGTNINNGSSNTFVGDDSGCLSVDACFNTFLGRQSGLRNTSGNSNVFLGCGAGCLNCTGSNNVYLGNNGGSLNFPILNGSNQLLVGSGSTAWINGNCDYNVGINSTAPQEKLSVIGKIHLDNTCGSVFLGQGNHQSGTSGSFDVAIGCNAMRCFNGTSSCSVAIGYQSMCCVQASSNSIAIGNGAAICSFCNSDSIFMGTCVGGDCVSNTCGSIYIGACAGRGDTGCSTNTGTNNIFLGTLTGSNNFVSVSNVFIGDCAGAGSANSINNGNCNIFVGKQAGCNICTGDHNIALGTLSGCGTSSGWAGSNNIFLGNNSGRQIDEGNYNIAIGRCAGYTNQDGCCNTFLGFDAGLLTTGSRNTFLGSCAGKDHTSGSGNVIIGDQMKQAWSKTGDHQLVVGAGGTSWIEGDSSFNVGIGTALPTTKLQVIGEVTATDFNTTSDRNLKTNIATISDPILKINQLRGVSFNWLENSKPAMGVIADEVQEIIPEIVNDTDPKTVNYNGLIGLLIEVVKDQQSQINELRDQLSKLN